MNRWAWLLRGMPAPGRRWSGALRTWLPGSGGRAAAVGRAGGGGPPALAPVPPPLPARPRCRFAAAAVCRACAGRVRARALPVTLPVLLDWSSGDWGSTEHLCHIPLLLAGARAAALAGAESPAGTWLFRAIYWSAGSVLCSLKLAMYQILPGVTAHRFAAL